MKTFQKWLLSGALASLIGGIFVSSNHNNLPLTLDVLMPLGVVLTGLFLITLLLRNEVTKFDEGERVRNEAIKRYRLSACDTIKKDKEEIFSAPSIIELVDRKPQICHQVPVKESVREVLAAHEMIQETSPFHPDDSKTA